MIYVKASAIIATRLGHMKSWSRPVVPSVPGSLPARVNAYDTVRRAVVPVGPDPAEGTGPARIYVCGITPYDATHLGHAATYLAYDLLIRAWLDAGLDVRYAQNVTDIDEPLLERAAATGVDWEELALEQTALFREDMEALRIIPPDYYIGAVECVPCVAALVKQLCERGYTYDIDDPEYPDIYFPAPTAPGFGAISGLAREEMIVKLGHHGGDPERSGKHDPLDVVVWRRARADEPTWETMLGSGRPGWHAECTAISLRYLGPHADVQGGGLDLVFPHHEMCAAQAAAATDEPLAEAFVHAGMVAYQGEKMSKSRGNLVFVSELRKAGIDPMVIRLALLNHHCRSHWEWTAADLQHAEQRLASWRAAIKVPGAPADGVVSAIRMALRDDQDAPRALAAVDAWVHTSGNDASAGEQVRVAVDALLGVAL